MRTHAQLVVGVLLVSGCSVGNGKPTLQTTRDPVLSRCPDAPPPDIFGGGLCVCEDFDSVGDLRVSPMAPGGEARVGVNGLTELVGEPRVEGSMVAWGGLTGVGDVSVTGTLATTASLEGVGTVKVGGDLIVGGDLTGVGELDVGGAVRVGGLFESVGSSRIGGLGAYAAPALPCACGKAEVLDVAAEVAKAKLHPDNQALGLPAMDLLGEANLVLGTGRYSFEHVSTLGDTTLDIQGAVSIFIDGDLEAVGTQNLRLAPGATLDLYVAGNVDLVGDTDFGGEPGRFRLYIGGKSPVGVSVGNQKLRGSIYAPEAELSFVGDTLVEGALFAKSLTGVGTLEIRHAAVAAPSAAVCDAPPELPAFVPAADAGTGACTDANGAAPTLN